MKPGEFRKDRKPTELQKQETLAAANLVIAKNLWKNTEKRDMPWEPSSYRKNSQYIFNDHWSLYLEQRYSDTLEAYLHINNTDEGFSVIQNTDQNETIADFVIRAKTELKAIIASTYEVLF